MQLSRILQNCWKNTNTPQQSERGTPYQYLKIFKSFRVVVCHLKLTCDLTHNLTFKLLDGLLIWEDWFPRRLWREKMNSILDSIRVTSATSAGHLLPRVWRSANIPAEILTESPAGRPAISKFWPSWERSTKREDSGAVSGHWHRPVCWLREWSSWASLLRVSLPYTMT